MFARILALTFAKAHDDVRSLSEIYGRILLRCLPKGKKKENDVRIAINDPALSIKKYTIMYDKDHI